MKLKNIEEAKKYIGKIIYTASDHEKSGKFKVIPLYIGGINLHYNQVNYEIEGFSVWEDKNYKEFYGDIKSKDIRSVFDGSERFWMGYFFSKSEAEKYKEWRERDDIEREREYDIKTAKELLDTHNIKYEIFD